MPMTTTQQTDAYRFFAIAFSAAPGVEYMNQIAAAYEGGATTKQIVNEFTKKSVFTNVYPNFLTNESFAARLIDNVVGSSATDAAKTEAKADVVAALAKGSSRGDVIFQIFSNLAGLTGDAKWGNVALKMANQVATSQYYTETLLKTSTDIATLQAVLAGVDHTTSVTTAALDARLNPPPAGQTYTLTTGLDNLTGSAGNDTFVALVDTTAGSTTTTLGNGDSVTGGAGTDKLAITITGTGASATYGAASRADVETLEVTNLGASAHTVDTTLMPNLTALSVVGGASAVTFAGVQGLDAVNMQTSQNVTVNLLSPTGTGVNDTASVTLNGSAASTSNTLTYNGIENFNVALSGSPTGSIAAATATTITSGQAKSFTLTGNQNAVLSLTTAGAATANDTHTINASATTGNVTINYNPTGAATKASVSLGSGNDTLNVTGTLTTSYTVSGGAGTDVLGISAAVGYDTVTAVSQGDNITGFETLRTNASVTQDMRGLSKNSITGLQVYGGVGTLTNSPVISTLLIGGTGTGASISLATASNTSNDSIAVTLGEANLNTPVSAASPAGAVALTLNNYEKVSIASTGAANGTVSLTSAALTELTVTGDQNVTVNAGTTSTAVTKVDASAHTGTSISVSAASSAVATTYTLGGQLNATVTGGDGADTITGASGNDLITSGAGADSIVSGAGLDTIDSGTGNDIISAGAGADSVSAGDGADSVDGGAGNDTILGGLGNDTVLGGDGNDSIDAGSGDDSVDGGAGLDTITAGSGTDTISGGDGNDTIIFGSSLTTGDSVDGGAGTDTLTATISASITPVIVNVENLDFTGGFATGAVTSADAYGTAVNLTSSTGATTARVQLTGTTSAGLINMPSTLATVQVADAGVMATGNSLNLRWASSPTSATVIVDTLGLGTGTSGIVTAGANTLTLRQATTTAYNDTAGTGRVYSASLNSTTGTVTTDARTLTVDMPTLAAAQATGAGFNLDVGAVTANSAESITVQAGDYARARTSTIDSTNADFSRLSVTSGTAGVTTTGVITASSASTVSSATISAGTLGATTVGNLVFGSSTAITRMDITAGLSGNVTLGTITAGSIGTLNVEVGVNGTIGGATGGTTVIAPAVTTSATFTLGSNADENFTITGGTSSAHGAYTLTGAGTAVQTFTFTNGATLASFSASGFSGQLVFDGTGISGNIGVVTGTAKADTLLGGGGNDSLSGGLGADSLSGGAGADSLTGGEGADTINGGGGNDTISLTETVAAVDRIVFGTAAGNGADTITGFTFGTGGDVMDVSAYLGAAVDASNGATTMAKTIAGSLDLTGGGDAANVATLTDIQTLTAANFGGTASATVIKTAANSKYVIIADVTGDADTIQNIYFVTTDGANAATVTLVGTVNESTTAAVAGNFI